MEFKKYHAYFCHASADINWVMNLIYSLESECNFNCAEYERDFIGGKIIFDMFEQFMESSHFIVVALSPSFVESRWAMFQLTLAVHFSLGNNQGNIIPLVYKDCEIPLCMKMFDPVYVSKMDWRMKLIDRLRSPAKRFPKARCICTRDGRISIDALRTFTTRDVMSEPVMEDICTAVSEHNFYKLKAFDYRRRGTLNCTPVDGQSGIMDIQKRISPGVINSGEQSKEVRTKDIANRADAETLIKLHENTDAEILVGGTKSKIIRQKKMDKTSSRMEAEKLMNIHQGMEQNNLDAEQFRKKRKGDKPTEGRERCMKSKPGISQPKLAKKALIQTDVLDDADTANDRHNPSQTRDNSPPLSKQEEPELAKRGDVRDASRSEVTANELYSDDLENVNPGDSRKDSSVDLENSIQYRNTSLVLHDDKDARATSKGDISKGELSKACMYRSDHISSFMAGWRVHQSKTEPESAEKGQGDRFCPVEHSLEKRLWSLPRHLVWEGERAKQKRLRPGRREKRIDADDLLCDSYIRLMSE